MLWESWSHLGWCLWQWKGYSTLHYLDLKLLSSGSSGLINNLDANLVLATSSWSEMHAHEIKRVNIWEFELQWEGSWLWFVMSLTKTQFYFCELKHDMYGPFGWSLMYYWIESVKSPQIRHFTLEPLFNRSNW